MPQQIDIPGMGVVEFPDGMSDDQITAAIKQNMPAPKIKPFKGSLLPISWDDQGNASFDSGAGILGAIKRAVTLPRDVMSGDVKLPSSQGIPGAIDYSEPGANEGLGRVLEAAAVASPMVPRSASGVAAVGIPTRQALENTAKAGFNDARAAAVDINPAATKSLADRIRIDLEKNGVIEEFAPDTFAVLRKLDNPPEGAVTTIGNLHSLRQALGNAGQSFTKPKEQFAATSAIKHLDDYLSSIPQTDVLRGDAQAASDVLRDSIGNYAAAKRSERITDATEVADLNAAAANSGQNIGNATRQRINSILKSDKQSQGYSSDELAQMERVVRGTGTGNATRFAGNLLGGGGGLGAVATAAAGGAGGGAIGGPLGSAIGAMLPVAGYGLKKISDASVQRQIRLLDEMVRSRSPVVEAMMQNPSVGSVQTTPAVEAVMRALIANRTQMQAQ